MSNENAGQNEAHARAENDEFQHDPSLPAARPNFFAKIARNGYVVSGAFFLAGSFSLFLTLHFQPDGVIKTLLSIAVSLFFFLMVPRGGWIAEQLRYRSFVARSDPFPSVEASWEAFRKQDASIDADDPLLRRWQSLIDAREREVGQDAARRQ